MHRSYMHFNIFLQSYRNFIIYHKFLHETWCTFGWSQTGEENSRIDIDGYEYILKREDSRRA